MAQKLHITEALQTHETTVTDLLYAGGDAEIAALPPFALVAPVPYERRLFTHAHVDRFQTGIGDSSGMIDFSPTFKIQLTEYETTAQHADPDNEDAVPTIGLEIVYHSFRAQRSTIAGERMPRGTGLLVPDKFEVELSQGAQIDPEVGSLGTLAETTKFGALGAAILAATMATIRLEGGRQYIDTHMYHFGQY